MDTYARCRKFFRTQKIILSKNRNFCCSGGIRGALSREIHLKNPAFKALPYIDVYLV